ncbi:MAG: AraC family transcriptional regulator [bacterium]|nr:AraC family transcriptional regulator [bacterium]
MNSCWNDFEPAGKPYHEKIPTLDPSTGCRVFYDTPPGGFVSCPHWHEAVEIMSVLKGTAVKTVNGVSFSVNAGDVIIVGGMDIHNMSVPADEHPQFIVIQFIPSDWDDNLPEKMLLSGRGEGKERYLISGETGRRIYEYSAAVMQEDQSITARALAVRGYMYLILTELLRLYPCQAMGEKRYVSLRSQLQDLAGILARINADLSAPPTLSEAASIAGMSAAYFSRFFKHKLGKGYIEYIHETRLNRSAHLLCSTQLPIGEIALQTGFNSANFFNRLFIRRYGVTPTQFRKSSPSFPMTDSPADLISGSSGR